MAICPLENNSNKVCYLFLNILSGHLMRLIVVKLFLTSTFPSLSNISAWKTKHLELCNLRIEATPKNSCFWTLKPWPSILVYLPTEEMYNLCQIIFLFPTLTKNVLPPEIIRPSPVFILHKLQHSNILRNISVVHIIWLTLCQGVVFA